jgi:putative endonuclease
MFYCYVLRSQKTGRRYVGSCRDLDTRVQRHNRGESKATKHGVPWLLIHCESFSTRPDATARERYFKTGRSREELDQWAERSPRRQVAGSNPVTPTTRMNFRRKLIAQIFCGALYLANAHAQEAALPSMDEALPATSPTPTATATLSPSPEALSTASASTPAPSPPALSRTEAVRAAAAAAVPGIAQLDEMFKQTPMGKDAEELRLHVQTRELQNRIADDPQVAAAKAATHTATTDLEKRERLRRYYEITYGRMRAMAGSAALKKYIDALKAKHLSALDQPRVRSATPAELKTTEPAED